MQLMRCSLFCTMSKEISSWLENGSNYQEGVSLYDRIGSDNFYKRLFQRGENAFNKKKLAEALGTILMSVPEELVLDPEPTLVEPALPESKDPPPATPPRGTSELLKIIGQINNNYAEMRGLHPYLSVYPEGEDLRLLAVQIVQRGKRNAQLWERRNYLSENGPEQEEIEPPKIPVMIDYNLLQERERIRKSLNKAENRLKKQKTPKDFTLVLVAERKQQLQEIDARISDIKAKGATHE